MLFILAIILPPLAVLLAGRPFAAILNILLTCFFWIPGIIHAMSVIGDHSANRRVDRQTKALVEAQRQMNNEKET